MFYLKPDRFKSLISYSPPMKKSDIEALLGTGEFRNLDFKASHELDKNAKIEITKDLLAFSNTPDGGRIIVGVKENKDDLDGKRFELTGMEPEHLCTWTHDNLADTARNFADPFVEFEFETVPVGERVCMVIKIQEFQEIPVICKQRSGDTLRSGAIYTRTYGKRESAEVRSQTEVREILNMATEKNIRKFIGTAMKVGLPLTLSPTDSDKFDKQLEDFLTSEDSIKEKLRSRGYWKIVIRPSKFAEK
jgi:predicted HTH transcriptional regulator